MSESKVYIAGHTGMVGSAILSTFQENGHTNIVTRSSDVLDLRNQSHVNDFIAKELPDVIILAAARVGGILANDQYPYQFLYDNLSIQNNVISAAHKNNVERLVFLGSSCIYPKYARQPIREEYLLTGALEPTNEWYAVAKIAGLKLCEALSRQYGRNYVSLMPTNLYGPRDNFDLESSHVVPAMVRKFHEAKVNGHSPVVLWGSGSPKREFLHVRDLAEAVLFALNHQLDDQLYNIGTGSDCSIEELALLVQEIVGHKGNILWDRSKPDGTPRKLLDVSKIHSAGWHHRIQLREGLEETYDWFLKNKDSLKTRKLQAK